MQEFAQTPDSGLMVQDLITSRSRARRDDADRSAAITFRNPILPAPSADPWLMFHQGFYYYCESRLEKSIYIRRSTNLHNLTDDPGTLVWTPPDSGPSSQHLWAPELHRIDEKWYIYYAADDGENANHRMWVLESESDDPLGPYRCRGSLDTSGWAIDGTLFDAGDGSRYFLWSGWEGAVDGQQNLYIAPMLSPTKLAGPRRMLTQPEMPWERIEMPICEGPQVLRRNGQTFVIYSASGSWCEDYCLGMLVLTGNNPLDPDSWVKVGPVFQKTESVLGVGHCSFIQTGSGQDWILYHTKTKPKNGWCDRNVHAQPFEWSKNGLPVFGFPVAPGVPLQLPE